MWFYAGPVERLPPCFGLAHTRRAQHRRLAFLRDWTARAHGLGWTALDLFGVHPAKPWGRLDVMGLVPLLHGREVAALNRDRATIKMAGGQVLTYRRVQATCPTDACLVWGLR